MRCSICGGHLTNQRCDDCGMIFLPLRTAILCTIPRIPTAPPTLSRGRKPVRSRWRRITPATGPKAHRAPQPSQRPTKPTYQNSNSGRRKGSQIPGLIIALVWVVICLMISFANISFANMR